MALSGVRSSWDMLARNWLLSSVARTSSRFFNASACSFRRLSSSTLVRSMATTTWSPRVWSSCSASSSYCRPSRRLCTLTVPTTMPAERSGTRAAVRREAGVPSGRKLRGSASMFSLMRDWSLSTTQPDSE